MMRELGNDRLLPFVPDADGNNYGKNCDNRCEYMYYMICEYTYA